MTIDQAFESLLDDPYLWGKTGKPSGLRYNLRYWVRKGKYVSMTRKIELLELAGFEVVVSWGE